MSQAHLKFSQLYFGLRFTANLIECDTFKLGEDKGPGYEKSVKTS